MRADSRFEAVLAKYNERAQREAVEWSRTDLATLFAQRDQYLLQVGEEVGRFLHALAHARGAKRILEVGTSYGYSTLFLADAARLTGGEVVTLDLSAEKQDYARRQLGEAGLDGYVRWLQGDAVSLLDQLDGPFDFVLLDVWKEIYIPCFHKILPKLSENAVLAADNMLEPKVVRPEAEAYRAVVRSEASLQSVLLPIGQGIELSCVWRGPPQ